MGLSEIPWGSSALSQQKIWANLCSISGILMKCRSSPDQFRLLKHHFGFGTCPLNPACQKHVTASPTYRRTSLRGFKKFIKFISSVAFSAAAPGRFTGPLFVLLFWDGLFCVAAIPAQIAVISGKLTEVLGHVTDDDEAASLTLRVRLDLSAPEVGAADQGVRRGACGWSGQGNWGSRRARPSYFLGAEA